MIEKMVEISSPKKNYLKDLKANDNTFFLLGIAADTSKTWLKAS